MLEYPGHRTRELRRGDLSHRPRHSHRVNEISRVHHLGHGGLEGTADAYWYWMYNGRGLSRKTSLGVSMRSPFFVSLWKNNLNPVNCTGSAFT